MFARVYRVREQFDLQLGEAGEDESGLYEDMEAIEPAPENALPLQSTAPGSPEKFLKRRSLPSDIASEEALETPLKGLDSIEGFEVPADMTDSQKHELADLLLQIQQMELRCFPELSCCCLCVPYTCGL